MNRAPGNNISQDYVNEIKDTDESHTAPQDSLKNHSKIEVDAIDDLLDQDPHPARYNTADTPMDMTTIKTTTEDNQSIIELNKVNTVSAPKHTRSQISIKRKLPLDIIPEREQYKMPKNLSCSELSNANKETSPMPTKMYMDAHVQKDERISKELDDIMTYIKSNNILMHELKTLVENRQTLNKKKQRRNYETRKPENKQTHCTDIIIVDDEYEGGDKTFVDTLQQISDQFKTLMLKHFTVQNKNEGTKNINDHNMPKDLKVKIDDEAISMLEDFLKDYNKTRRRNMQKLEETQVTSDLLDIERTPPLVKNQQVASQSLMMVPQQNQWYSQHQPQYIQPFGIRPGQQTVNNTDNSYMNLNTPNVNTNPWMLINNQIAQQHQKQQQYQYPIQPQPFQHQNNQQFQQFMIQHHQQQLQQQEQQQQQQQQQTQRHQRPRLLQQQHTSDGFNHTMGTYGQYAQK